MAIVDSKEQKLGLPEIVREGILEDDELSQYKPAVAFAAILSKLNMPKTVVRQTGNTLWIIHRGKKRLGTFNALNADTEQNLIDNTREFFRWAYDDVGMDILQTESQGDLFLNLFEKIYENPVREDMGYLVLEMNSGANGGLLKLGPERR
jgi:hypothetical protein